MGSPFYVEKIRDLRTEARSATAHVRQFFDQTFDAMEQLAERFKTMETQAKRLAESGCEGDWDGDEVCADMLADDRIEEHDSCWPCRIQHYVLNEVRRG